VAGPWIVDEWAPRKGTKFARSLLTWNAAVWWICWQIAWPPEWQIGSGKILKSRLSTAIVMASMLTRPVRVAVLNAVLEPWSNGRTEGQINKLKTLKRTMYGRAGVNLLRARLMPLHG
jgi:Transposase